VSTQIAALSSSAATELCGIAGRRRMAGMHLLLLFAETSAPYWRSLMAGGCETAKLSAVPLWKVIVGPHAGELYRTRKGPVSFWPFSADAVDLPLQLADPPKGPPKGEVHHVCFPTFRFAHLRRAALAPWPQAA
jgi:hypothetical protein